MGAAFKSLRWMFCFQNVVCCVFFFPFREPVLVFLSCGRQTAPCCCYSTCRESGILSAQSIQFFSFVLQLFSIV